MTTIEYPKFLTIALIDWYQAYLSPWKGFCCAHRALHGKSSCSEWIKRLIMRLGLLRAAPLAIRRFRSCRQAYEMISRRLEDTTKKGSNKKDDANSCPCMNTDSAICCIAEGAVASCS